MLLANTAVLAAILLPLASAKCYNNGPVFVNKQFGLDNVYNTAIMLQGELQSGQVRGTCVTDKNGGYNWYFSVRNVGKSGQTLDKNKIDGYLRAEIHNCGLKGGYTKHDWIEYNSDPNAGVCTDDKYINIHEPPVKPEVQRRGGAIIPHQGDVTFTEVSTLAALRPEALFATYEE